MMMMVVIIMLTMMMVMYIVVDRAMGQCAHADVSMLILFEY